MPASDATTAAHPLPPTCNVLGLVCFWPGYHKGTLYTPEMVARLPQNFALLKGHTTPRAKVDGTRPGAKIGHDKRQLIAERLKQSMGFLSTGDVTRCDPVDGFPDYVELDIRNVPTRAVGGEIAAGRLVSTSVELLPDINDPADPTRSIKGPILTGVAFLGEEQPALRDCRPELRDRTKPQATFDDGRPVPANPDIPREWLDAQSDVTRQMADELGGEFSAERRTVRYRGREFSERTLCFSDITEVTAMDPKAQLAALGLTPEQVDQAMKICAGAAAPPPVTAADAADPTAAPPPGAPAPMGAGLLDTVKGAVGMSAAAKFAAKCKAFSEDPKATDEQKMMAAMFAEQEEMKKQFGAMAKFAEDAQKKNEDAKTAAFSAQVDTECRKIARKLDPVVIATVVRPNALNILTAKTFSSESDRLKTFSDYFAGFARLPDDSRLAGQSVAAPTPAASNNPILAAIVRKGGVMDRLSPAITKTHRDGTAA